MDDGVCFVRKYIKQFVGQWMDELAWFVRMQSGVGGVCICI